MKNLKSSDEVYLIPSKTFLWGEYSALKGGHAGVVATDPCFAFSSSEIFDPKTSELLSKQFFFHPQSPAGRFIDYCKNTLKLSEEEILSVSSCHLYDPHEGSGGFGQSTAEFVYVIHKLSQRISFDLQTLWTLYRSFYANQTPPSGYDLATQLKPDFNLVHVLGNQLRIESKPWPFTRLSFLIFKTRKKVFTHEHISKLEEEQLHSLLRYSESISNDYMQEDQSAFLEALNAFQMQLEALDLVCAETVNILSSLRQIQAVDFAKGCGALGADVVAVFCKKQYKNQVLNQIEQSLGEELKFIADEQSVIFGSGSHF